MQVKEEASELSFLPLLYFSILILLHVLWRSKHMQNLERMLLVKYIKNQVMSQIQFPICCFWGSIIFLGLNFSWKCDAKYNLQWPFLYFSKDRFCRCFHSEVFKLHFTSNLSLSLAHHETGNMSSASSNFHK